MECPNDSLKWLIYTVFSGQMTDPQLRELQGLPKAQLAMSLEGGLGQRSGMLAAMGGYLQRRAHHFPPSHCTHRAGGSGAS